VLLQLVYPSVGRNLCRIAIGRLHEVRQPTQKPTLVPTQAKHETLQWNTAYISLFRDKLRTEPSWAPSNTSLNLMGILIQYLHVRYN